MLDDLIHGPSPVWCLGVIVMILGLPYSTLLIRTIVRREVVKSPDAEHERNNQHNGMAPYWHPFFVLCMEGRISSFTFPRLVTGGELVYLDYTCLFRIGHALMLALRHHWLGRWN